MSQNETQDSELLTDISNTVEQYRQQFKDSVKKSQVELDKMKTEVSQELQRLKQVSTEAYKEQKANLEQKISSLMDQLEEDEPNKERNI